MKGLLHANVFITTILLLSMIMRAQALSTIASSSLRKPPAAFLISSQNTHRHNFMAPLSLKQPSSSSKYSFALSAEKEDEASSSDETKEVNDGDDKDDDNDVESAPPPKAKRVEDILRDLHRSGLPFRIVVIGNGAILETTQTLAPTFKSTISPKTNEKLITIANTDQSFEFHVKVEQVSKVTFTETDKKSPADGSVIKTLRIVRFLDDVGRPICSLILADGGSEQHEEGKMFWRDLTIRYGYEVQL